MRRRVFILWLGIVFASFLLIVILVGYGLLRLLPSYQHTIEDVLSQMTGSKVSLQIEYADWRGLDPVVKVGQIMVNGHDFSLNIPEMTVRIDGIRSLIAWNFVTKSIVIDSPKLKYYSETNKIDNQFLQLLSVEEINQIGGCWSRVLDYLLQQQRLSLKGMIVVIDLRSQGIAWELTLNMDYTKRKQQKGLLNIAISPLIAKQNTQVEITAVIEQKDDKYYFDSNLMDKAHVLISVLNNLSDKIKFEPLIGNQINLFIQSSIKGLDEISMIGELSELELETKLLQKTKFKNISFNLRLFRYQGRFMLDVNPLTFVTHNKHYIFRSTLMALDNHRLMMNVSRFNLADFSNLTQLDVVKWRKDLILSGQLTNLQLSFDLQEMNMDGVQLSANFNNLGVTQSDKRFDFTGLTGQLWWQKNSAKILLNAPNFTLGENTVFTKVWPQFNAVGELNIIKQQDKVIVYVPNLQLNNKTINFSAKGNIDVPLDQPLNFTLDIKANLTGQHVTTEYQSFLPKHGIPIALYDWLMKSLYGAKAVDASLKIKGVARNIPFADDSGVFKIDANIQDGKLIPYFGLGVAYGLNGSLHFDNEQLSAKVDRGMLGGIPIKIAHVSVDNIARNIPATLTITGSADTNSKQAYTYLESTEYGKLVNELSHYAKLQANTSISLGIEIPFGDQSRHHRFYGKVSINDGLLSIYQPFVYNIYAMEGEIAFNNSNVFIHQIKAMLNKNFPVALTGSLNIENPKNPTVMLTGKTTIPFTEGNFNPLTKFSTKQKLSGTLPISFALNSNFDKGEFKIDSNFIGLTSTLGAPFNKTAFESLPIELKLSWQKDNNIGKPIDIQQISKAQFEVETKLNIANQTDLTTGFNFSNKGIGALSMTGHIHKLSLDFLLNLANMVDQAILTFRAQNQLQQLTALNTPLVEDKKTSYDNCLIVANYANCIYRNLSNWLKPKINLDIGLLDVCNTIYQDVNLKTAVSQHYTNIELTANNSVKITIDIPQALQKPIEVNADNLSFRLSSDKFKKEKEQQTRNDAQFKGVLAKVLNVNTLQKIPNANIKLTNLQVGGYGIPNILVAVNIRAGVLFIPVLSAYDPSSKLLASVQLSPQGSTLQLNAFSLNWGNLLNSFGYENFLKSTSGDLNANFSWSKLMPSFSNIKGNISIDLLNGVILSIDAGIAKYIGLLSLDAYFKRLFLPYNDFEHQGMPFNHITGRYDLKDGIAISQPSVVIDTPGFALIVQGDINILNKTLNQRIKYQPHFSGTTAAVAGALGGPVVALATYLGGKVLGNTLFRNMGLVSFDVVGNWDKPTLKQVQ